MSNSLGGTRTAKYQTRAASVGGTPPELAGVTEKTRKFRVATLAALDENNDFAVLVMLHPA